MEHWSKKISAINFGGFTLLVMLFFLSDKILVPKGLMLIGRLHPLILHLPIGMFVVLVLLLAFKQQIESLTFQTIFGFFIQLATFTALISAIFGLLLASEPDAYSGDLLDDHKNGGFAFAVLMYFIASVYHTIGVKWLWVLMVVNAIILTWAGHQGAEITHGKDFLFPEKKASQLNIQVDSSSAVYSSIVQPILNQKCISCHNSDKSKGDLILTDSINLLKGGKNGPLWIAGDAIKSNLLHRIHLPIGEEEHMPPEGKPQLTKAEADIILHWIKSGASFSKALKDFSPLDTLYRICHSLIALNNQPIKNYNFSFVDQKILSELNTSYRTVKPFYYQSPALEATYFLASEYTNDKLRELSVIKSQLISLNLARMPLDEQSMELISTFTKLENLILNSSGITDQGLVKLENLDQLEHLSLVNTKVTLAINKSLAKMKSIKKVFISNTSISSNDVVGLQKKLPRIHFYHSEPDNILTALSPPILVNENTIIDKNEFVTLSHPIKGVMIKYTIDGKEPDSLHGLKYEGPIKVNSAVDIKCQAYKEGWLKSEMISFSLFLKGLPPFLATLHNKANDQYPGTGPTTLINSSRGPIANLKDQNWIAFRESPFTATFMYQVPKPINRISFSYGLHIPQYVFPPTYVKVFAGNDLDKMMLQKVVNVDAFDSKNKNQVKNEVIHIDLSGKPYKYFKIEAQNLPSIPNWHPGKGEKGWLFMDEIFFYE